MKKLRIIIADDHSLIRQGIRSVIASQPGWELCGETNNGRTAVELAQDLSPDIAVLDVTMPGLNGVDAIRLMKTASPNTKALILTMHDSDSLAEEVMLAGGSGYLLKSDAAELLPQAIEEVASGRHFMTSQLSFQAGVQSLRPEKSSQTPSPVRSRLTPREREIVQCLAEGKTNKQVADALRISLGTVETHRKNILGKLGVRSAADLVLYAIRNKLIQP